MEPEAAFESFFEDAWPPCDESAYGSGAFGKWITDAAGRPAFEHTGASQSNHWHLLGNDRVAATAHAPGFVQLYDWSRGGKLLNRWDPGRGQFAGGFKFLAVNGAPWCTLLSHLPPGAAQTRVFGTGYFEKTTVRDGLRVQEHIEAPAGDDPVLLSTTTAENRSETPVTVTLVEFWGVNLHQITGIPIMPHRLVPLIECGRARLNKHFRMEAAWDAASRCLSVAFAAKRPHRVPQPERAAMMDFHPKAMFLAALEPLPGDFCGYTADYERFFGAGALSEPPGARGEADGALFRRRCAYRGRAVLAMRREFRLGPGKSAITRYLVGYECPERVPGLVARYSAPQQRTERPSIDFVAPDVPWLRRELAWHAYYLQAGSVYSEFFDAHIVDQGSAYAYMQGGSGAPRDFALHALPLVYLRPDLAREALVFLMRLQDRTTGAFPYVFTGHGVVSGAFLHNRSSDLDLFFFWVLSEYLAAIQDLGFLDTPVAWYPPASTPAVSVLEHARAAFRHLTDRVGVGPHGLLRCGTGDWNDVLCAFSWMPFVTALRGESSLNAGLATVALPALADAVAAKDPDFAAALRRFAADQARALETMWAGDYAARGYLGYGGRKMGHDRIFLDTQPFGVLGGVWDAPRRRKLFDSIDRLCVSPQPFGARCLYPAFRGLHLRPGVDTNGGVWAAIDSWLAWAWGEEDPQRAWDFYLRTTLAAHAAAYPGIWYGVWSGPDCYNAHYHPRAGETSNFIFTPMQDYPMMNMNRHSGALLTAIKLAGIRPRGNRIVIDPHVPFDRFVVRLPLLGFAYLPDKLRGYYVPQTSSLFRFAVRLPSGIRADAAILRVQDGIHPCEFDEDGFAVFSVSGAARERVRFEFTGKEART